MARPRRRLELALLPAAAVAYAAASLHVIFNLNAAGLEYDFGQFYDGARALATGHDPYSVYLHCCRGQSLVPLKGYIYPPLLALLTRPLVAFGEVPAAVVWFAILQACLLAAVLLAGRSLGPMLTASARTWLLAGALAFPPLLQNLSALQVGTPVILLLVVAGAAFLEDATTPLAGIALALGGALRVSPALASLALLRRRRSSLVGLLLAALSGLFLLGLMYIATPVLPEYLGRVLPALGQGSAVFDNAAPTGIALRADRFLFTGSGGSMRYAGPAISLLVVAVTLWSCRGTSPDRRRRAAVFAAWTAAIPLVSSITWSHHLATELVVFAFLAPSLRGGSRAWWLAAVAYPLLWASLVIEAALVLAGVASAADIGAPGVLLISALPAGGMLLLWLACLDAARPPILDRATQ